MRIRYFPYSGMAEIYTMRSAATLIGITEDELWDECIKTKVDLKMIPPGEVVMHRDAVCMIHSKLYWAERKGGVRAQERQILSENTA